MSTMSVQPQVSMHPELSRAGTSSSPSSDAFAGPLFSIDDLVACPPRPTRRPSLTPTQSSYAAAAAATTTTASHAPPLPAQHGLVNLDPHSFPLLTTRNDDPLVLPEIRVLTADQFASLQADYSRCKLPERVLFPWSHGGADVPYTPASQYFGFRSGTAAAAPSYRGLTVIHAPSAVERPAPGNIRRGLTTSSGWSESSNGSISSDASSSPSPSPSPPPQNTIPTALLVSSFPASAIVSRPLDGPATFSLPAPTSFKTVNLRNFALQGPKYASVSDIVVYGEHGIDESVVDVAIRVKEAQDIEWQRRGAQGVKYNVYVVSDPFKAFENKYPGLVAIDSDGFVRNKLSFFQREHEEMRVLTEASEIAENVWLGNTHDVPRAPYAARHLTSDSTSSLIDDGNPNAFSICIEAHDTANTLPPGVLTAADRALTELEQYDQVRQLLEETNEQAILRPHVEDLVHLECPASINSAVEQSPRGHAQLINGLVDLALWIHKQASPLGGNKLARRVLIHCGDGYTESSLLAVTYVMLAYRCTAPDAYLHLQNFCGRSFFVYAHDKATVIRLEHRVADVLKREDEEARLVARMEAAAVAARSKSNADEDDLTMMPEDVVASSTGMERSDSGYVSNASSSTCESMTSSMSSSSSTSLFSSSSAVKSLFNGSWYRRGSPDRKKESSSASMSRTGSAINLSSQSSSQEQEEPPIPMMELSSPESHPWFYDELFDSHFPSRILPDLYLGNLRHAGNALMLKELGITHVVSMGESALTPPRAPALFSSLGNKISSGVELPTNSLWLEERLGTISVLDMKNVADDGIDSIRPHIDQALAFMHEARQTGGKVLVHCRVGVSRSASIVIAYLMKHLQLDLVSSYLLTRSRRLNILIQPNLPFMAALHAFEADLLAENGDGDDGEDEAALGRAGLKRTNRLAWSYLSHEIAALNARFLCCCESGWRGLGAVNAG